MRLNRFLSISGICSRREADKFIEAGLVTVNGKVITELGVKVKTTDDVRYNGETIKAEKKVYLLLNKPKGFLTTMDDPKARKTVMELVGAACKERIYPVGRLDRATTGVILFTNDGDVAKKLTHPSHGARKIYQVQLDKNLKRADFDAIIKGVELEDGVISPDALSYLDERSKSHIGIEIHSGKNRIVRRIFESFGYEVVKLDRTSFAGLTKKGLNRGHYRFLRPDEINFLKTR
nr:pseudouridine synthase [Phaeocystidibacter marisrubri]